MTEVALKKKKKKILHPFKCDAPPTSAARMNDPV